MHHGPCHDEVHAGAGRCARRTAGAPHAAAELRASAVATGHTAGDEALAGCFSLRCCLLRRCREMSLRWCLTATGDPGDRTHMHTRAAVMIFTFASHVARTNGLIWCLVECFWRQVVCSPDARAATQAHPRLSSMSRYLDRSLWEISDMTAMKLMFCASRRVVGSGWWSCKQ